MGGQLLLKPIEMTAFLDGRVEIEIFGMTPSANVSWKYARGRPYSTPEHKAFIASLPGPPSCWVARSRPYGVVVDILVFRKGIRTCDTDNRIKPILDALQHCGWFDADEIVDDVSCKRRYKQPEFRTVIRIRPLLSHEQEIK